MSCLIELRQFTKPKVDETLSQSMFFIDTTIHYEVHYLPTNLDMNLKSYRKTILLPPHDDVDDNLRRKIFIDVLSRTLIPQSYFDSILVSVLAKLKFVASDSHSPVTTLSRFRCQLGLSPLKNLILNLKLNGRRCLIPREISSNTPATNKSVSELETIVYDGEDSGLECPICLKEFKVGEEMTMMPCFHCYQGDCIAKWLKNSHQCPSCRFPLPVCSVVEGSFPFYKRNHCRKLFMPMIGGKIRKKARMSIRYQVY